MSKEYIVSFRVFVLAFLLRFAYLNFLLSTPFFQPYGLDSAFFHSLAKQIIEGVSSRYVFVSLPLYPYFLAFVYKLSNANIYFAYLVQIFLSSLSCSLIYLIGKRTFGGKVGVVSALISCFYGMFIFYSCILVGITLGIFLSLLAILLLLRKEKEGEEEILPFPNSFLRFSCAGLILGLSSLVRAGIFLFFLLLIFYLLLKRVKKTLLLTFALFFLISPTIVLIRNYRISKEWLLTAHSGVNFYLANNPKAEGKFQGLLGRTCKEILENARLIAERKTGRSLTLEQASKFWQREAMRFIREHPSEFLFLFLKKFFIFYQAREIPDLISYFFLRKYSLSFLKLPFVSLRLVLPLAILGFLLTLRRQNLILHLFWLSQNLSLSLFWVNTRYRLLTVPVFIIFASFSLLWLRERIKRRERRKTLVFLSALLIFALLVNLKKEENNNQKAIFHYNTALAYSQVKEYNKAIQELNEALLLENKPSKFSSWIFEALGTVYYQKGEKSKAKEYFKKALKIYPQPDAHHNLGFIYQEEGKMFLAKQEYKRAINLNPHYPPAHYKLSQIYLEEGRVELALKEIEEVLKELPESREAKELWEKIKQRLRK